MRLPVPQWLACLAGIQWLPFSSPSWAPQSHPRLYYWKPHYQNVQPYPGSTLWLPCSQTSPTSPLSAASYSILCHPHSSSRTPKVFLIHFISPHGCPTPTPNKLFYSVYYKSKTFRRDSLSNSSHCQENSWKEAVSKMADWLTRTTSVWGGWNVVGPRDNCLVSG